MIPQTMLIVMDLMTLTIYAIHIGGIGMTIGPDGGGEVKNGGEAVVVRAIRDLP